MGRPASVQASDDAVGDGMGYSPIATSSAPSVTWSPTA